jgi:hypothetical protein
MRRPSITFLLLLFALFAVLTVAAANADITDAEARLLWIVRDPERVEPASISDTARLLTRNFRAMLDRAETRDLPLAVPLDVWTTLTGGSLFAARMAAVVALFLFAAVLTWLMRRLGIRRPLAGKILVVTLGIIALVGAVFLEFSTYGPPVSGVVARYQAERQPTEPVITVFSDDSPLGYYQAQVDLRRGIGIDLGWREFTAEEIDRAVANLGSGTVWLFVEDYRRYAAIDPALAATGRRATLCEGRYQRAAVIRYDGINESADPDARQATCPES